MEINYFKNEIKLSQILLFEIRAYWLAIVVCKPVSRRLYQAPAIKELIFSYKDLKTH